MAKSVLNSKEVLIVDDAASGQDRKGVKLDNLAPQLIKGEHVKSFVGLGIRAGEKTLGILFVNFRRQRQIEDEDINPLKIIAGQAAASIYRARLFERGEKNQKAFKVAHDITRLIGSAAPLHSVWQLILSGALDITGATRGVIMLWEQEINQLVKVTSQGFDTTQPPVIIDPGEYNLLWKTVLEKDTETQLILENNAKTPACDSCKFMEMNSTLLIPLPAGENQSAYGLLILENPESAAFNIDDRDIMQKLAVYVDTAIQSDRNYADIQKHTRLQIGLLKAGLGITAVQEPRTTLQSIADNTGEALGCDLVTLYTYDPKKELINSSPIYS